MEQKFWAIIIAVILLLIVIGSIFSVPILERIDSTIAPRFHPGIWDQPVIRPPLNSSAGLFDYPFMFQYNPEASSGFVEKYKKYYRPTFVIGKGKNATIMLDVTSKAQYPITVRLSAIDDLPAGGISYRVPESLVIEPGKNGRMFLELTASPDAGLPEVSGNSIEENHQYPVGVWLESGNWTIGQGFFLKVTS
jgi:hypothetical protein